MPSGRFASTGRAYEERNVSKRQVATIKYPDRYSLKTDADRIKEAQDLTKLMNSVPGRKVKRELSKGIVQALLGGKVSVDDLEAINQEIDNAHYTNGDPQTIILAAQAGLVGEKTGSVALGFDDDEYLAARNDHAERLKLIAESQGMSGGSEGDPAARGVLDLSADPSAGAAEKAASRGNDLRDTTAPHVRGKGRFTGRVVMLVDIDRESQSEFRTGSGTVGTDVIRLGCAIARQTVTVTATAGHFKLALGGVETANIAFDAAAADVQTALESVVGEGNVAVSGDGGGPWTVDFAGTLRWQLIEAMTAVDVDLGRRGPRRRGHGQ